MTGSWLYGLRQVHIFDVAWSPDGSQIATAAGFEVRIFNASNGEVVQTLLGSTNNLLTVSWHPSGSYIAAGGMDNIVRVWNVVTGEQVETFDHATPVLTLDWNPNGEQLAFGGYIRSDSSSMIDIVDFSPVNP